MSRDEFVEKWRHELSGMVLDAIVQERKTGAELGMFCRGIMRKVDAKLLLIFQDLIEEPEPKPANNGAAATTTKASK